ncbi:DgyrCDS8190 [Dimorphilus gyrociliatus]|uniref:DgyrCDS8190 n=1 Tax=Dimorphilus gyrociliatus TaxID=2664684 RepID=A0A7I8VYJ5_9ANNE|nr:DgyrCDS8190 [Dimorphilus gyrociliatus]
MDNRGVQFQYLTGAPHSVLHKANRCMHDKNKSQPSTFMDHLLRLYPQAPTKISGAGELVPKSYQLLQYDFKKGSDIEFKDPNGSTEEENSLKSETSAINRLLTFNSPSKLTQELRKLMNSEKYSLEFFTPSVPNFINSHMIEPVCNDGKPVQLGSGCFGTVFLAALNNNIRRLVAVKFIRKNVASINDIIKEASFNSQLSRIHGTPCPEFFGLAKIESNEKFHSLALVSEFIGNENNLKSLTLYQLLRLGKRAFQKGSRLPFTDRDLVAILLHIISALAAIHHRSVYVNDLKADNILLRKEVNGWCTYIVDLGHATYGHQRAKFDLGNLTEEEYLSEYRQVAPETVYYGQCGPCSDVYSFGNIINKIYKSMRIQIGKIEELIDLCRKRDPRARPSTLWISKELEIIFNSI